MTLASVMYRNPIPNAASAPKETGIRALVNRAYGIDALVAHGVVRPMQWIARVVVTNSMERGLSVMWMSIGRLHVRAAAFVGRRMHDGDTGRYVWVLACGALVLLAALAVQGS